MRVMLIASGGSVPNGALCSAIHTAHGLADRGHHVTMLTPEGGYVAQQIDRVRVGFLTSPLVRWPLSEVKRIRDWVVDHHVEVVHTHCSRASAFGAMLRQIYGLPVVATAHANKIQLHWCCNDHVIAVSDSTRSYHIRHNLVLPWKITTILNSIDTRRYAPLDPPQRLAVRRQIAALSVREASEDSSLVGSSPEDVTVGAPLIGIVGNVVKRKGHIDAIAALPVIVARYPRARLVIMGHGSEEELALLRAKAILMGVEKHLLWAGHRADANRWMAAMDVIACPSLEEPFGLVAPEALACQTPVVATRLGGFLATVREGESGYLVDRRSPPQLATAILRLLDDPSRRLRFGLAGREWVTEHLSIERHFSRVEAVLESAARRKRRNPVCGISNPTGANDAA